MDEKQMSDEELYGKTFAILDALSVRYYPGTKPNVARTYRGRLDTQPKMCYDAVIGQITPLSKKFKKHDSEHFKRMKKYVEEIERRNIENKPLEPSDFYLYFYKEKYNLWTSKEKKAEDKLKREAEYNERITWR